MNRENSVSKNSRYRVYKVTERVLGFSENSWEIPSET